MAYTRTLKLALIALTITTGIFIFHVNADARDRGYLTVAGTKAAKQARVQRPSSRVSKIRRKYGKHKRRDNIDRLFAYSLVTALDDRGTGSGSDTDDMRAGQLQEKVRYSPRRSMSKIIHVSEEMKELGEERAERREARMIEQMDQLDIRFYRDNEAYDARFPSIVYLDLLRK